jgi:hypothetical protein
MYQCSNVMRFLGYMAGKRVYHKLPLLPCFVNPTFSTVIYAV